MTAITLWIQFIVARWKVFLPAAIIAVCLLWAGVHFGCGDKPTPHLDQKEVIEAQRAVDNQEREKMISVLVASDVRLKAIDSNIKAAEEAEDAARRSYANKTNQELAEELQRRLEESQ